MAILSPSPASLENPHLRFFLLIRLKDLDPCLSSQFTLSFPAVRTASHLPLPEDGSPEPVAQGWLPPESSLDGGGGQTCRSF